MRKKNITGYIKPIADDKSLEVEEYIRTMGDKKW